MDWAVGGKIKPYGPVAGKRSGLLLAAILATARHIIWLPSLESLVVLHNSFWIITTSGKYPAICLVREPLWSLQEGGALLAQQRRTEWVT